MLNEYFKRPGFLDRVCSGPVGAYAEGFCEHLKQNGFSRDSICHYIGIASHFGHWARKRHLNLDDFDEHACQIFLRHLGSCRCQPIQKKSGNARAPVRALIAYLLEIGAPLATKTSEPKMPLLSDFNHWMLEHRGLMPSTLASYNPIIDALLEIIQSDPTRLDASTLRAFILKQAGRHTSGAKKVTTAIRMFLRFLIAEGKCSARLEAAIPTVANRRLAALPRYLPSSDVERIVNSCDLSTPLGLRDRAILLLLARMALRAGDIVELKLGDIDWQHSTMRLFGKSRREVLLPLTQEVGDAILVYLEKGRPTCHSDHLFVRAVAPLCAFTSQAVSTIVLRAIRRAGVENAPCRGAYVLRHSAATHMLRQGASLEEIGKVLRHQSITTTAIYAKVDLTLLQLVAQPWPEVRSC